MVDQMTPKQRLKAISENRAYDRIPHCFGIGDAAARVTDIKVSEFHQDPKKQIEAIVAAYRTYGLDSLAVAIPIQQVLGAEVLYPDYSTPFVENPLNLEGEALNRLAVEDPRNNPHLKGFWQVLDGLFEAAGDEAPVTVTISGPFSAAGRVGGVTKLLSRVIKDPEYVHRLLEHITAAEISIINALEGYEVGFGIQDPVSSGSLISPRQYREFAKPYQTKLFDAMTRVSGRKPQIHVCGNTSKILKDMVETGAGSVSVDNVMDMDFVKREIGDDIIIVGNVKPTETMLMGTPKDVEEDLKDCIKKSWGAKGGYLPAFGCGLPIDTPPENLHALFGALRKYGKYPVEPENL